MRENSPPWASPPACRATKFSRRPQGRDVGVDRGALRWPWGGGSGEAQLGLGSCGREGWGLGAETQMLEGGESRRPSRGVLSARAPEKIPRDPEKIPRDPSSLIMWKLRILEVKILSSRSF